MTRLTSAQNKTLLEFCGVIGSFALISLENFFCKILDEKYGGNVSLSKLQHFDW